MFNKILFGLTNRSTLILILACGLLGACQNESTPSSSAENKINFQNKGHELIYNMSQKIGTYEKLAALKDVTYTYTYRTPDDQVDISTEKYIFNGELSYGVYETHQRTLPSLDGKIEQGYDGQSFWLKHQGEEVQDKKAIQRVIFNRGTNFYWFAMMQKLLDPGLIYEHVGQDTINNIFYDIVKVSFKSSPGKPTDIYQLYINQKTQLADQFLFTVVDFNVVATPFLMKLKYEEIDGLLIPTDRIYGKSNWDGERLDDNWTSVKWTDIQFNKGLSVEQFKL